VVQVTEKSLALEDLVKDVKKIADQAVKRHLALEGVVEDATMKPMKKAMKMPRKRVNQVVEEALVLTEVKEMAKYPAFKVAVEVLHLEDAVDNVRDKANQVVKMVLM